MPPLPANTSSDRPDVMKVRRDHDASGAEQGELSTGAVDKSFWVVAKHRATPLDVPERPPTRTSGHAKESSLNRRVDIRSSRELPVAEGVDELVGEVVGELLDVLQHDPPAFEGWARYPSDRAGAGHIAVGVLLWSGSVGRAGTQVGPSVTISTSRNSTAHENCWPRVARGRPRRGGTTTPLRPGRGRGPRFYGMRETSLRTMTAPPLGSLLP
jgi:hypothetical protein